MGKYYCEGTIKTIALSVAPRGEMTITIEPTPSFKVTTSKNETYACLVLWKNGCPAAPNARKGAMLDPRLPLKAKVGDVSLLELTHLKDNRSTLGFVLHPRNKSTQYRCVSLKVL